MPKIQHQDVPMATTIDLRLLSLDLPRNMVNCRTIGSHVSPIDQRQQASFYLLEPTFDYKTGKELTIDQTWTWIPVCRTWQRNREYSLEGCSENEVREIDLYLRVVAELSEIRGRPVRQGEANQYITDQGRWDEFRHIRSMNLHDPKRGRVPGITPNHFRITKLLGVGHGDGHPLTDFERY